MLRLIKIYILRYLSIIVCFTFIAILGCNQHVKLEGDKIIDSGGNAVENKDEKINFVIEYTVGTVHNPQTRVLGEVLAKDAESAVKQFIDPSHKNWKAHIGSKNRYYIRVENPMGFVSDMADSYTAGAGELIKNREGMMKYIVEFIERIDVRRKNIKLLGTTWAKDAESAVKKFLNPGHRNWVTDNETKNKYFIAIGDPSIKGLIKQHYTAKVEVKYLFDYND
ncbi:MAG: hypothetical protein OEW87_14400 [Flavobacteriaceae bacterium]|nr:hypothetical protein [Flavobacteriaceae bacterium]